MIWSVSATPDPIVAPTPAVATATVADAFRNVRLDVPPGLSALSDRER
jgi:hypothetical protein